MKNWMKYLVIGWSIVSVGIIVISYQVIKEEFIDVDYSVSAEYKNPEKINDRWEIIAEELFSTEGNGPWNDYKSITKKEFVSRIKKVNTIHIESRYKINKKLILIPLYILIIWAIPIMVFSLLGLLFSKRETIMLRDSEELTPHPADPNKVCLDKGYLIKIFEKLGIKLPIK